MQALRVIWLSHGPSLRDGSKRSADRHAWSRACWTASEACSRSRSIDRAMVCIALP